MVSLIHFAIQGGNNTSLNIVFQKIEEERSTYFEATVLILKPDRHSQPRHYRTVVLINRNKNISKLNLTTSIEEAILNFFSTHGANS